jgi:hypothetical protein
VLDLKCNSFQRKMLQDRRKTPSSNIQAPEKFQAPSTQAALGRLIGVEAWCFPGAWMLELEPLPFNRIVFWAIAD